MKIATQEEEKKQEEQVEEQEKIVELRFDDEESIVNNIPIDKFKQNAIQMNQGKLSKQQELKAGEETKANDKTSPLNVN